MQFFYSLLRMLYFHLFFSNLHALGDGVDCGEAGRTRRHPRGPSAGHRHAAWTREAAPGEGADPGTADAPRPELVFLQLLKDRGSDVCKALEHEVDTLGERGATWRVHRGLAGEV